MHDDTSPGSEKYEQRDAHLKLILAAGVLLSLSALVCFLIGYVIMNGFNTRSASTEFVASPLAEDSGGFAVDVRLQADPPLALEQFLADQHALVRGWGTVSEEPLAYRIPIETALDIVAANGFPDVRPNPELPALESENEGAN